MVIRHAPPIGADEFVRTRAPVQDVVASPADQHVVARAAIEGVVTCAAEQKAVAGDEVVARGAGQSPEQ